MFFFETSAKTSRICRSPLASSDPNSAATMSRNQSPHASASVGRPGTSGSRSLLKMAMARSACSRSSGSGHQRGAAPQTICPIWAARFQCSKFFLIQSAPVKLSHSSSARRLCLFLARRWPERVEQVAFNPAPRAIFEILRRSTFDRPNIRDISRIFLAAWSRRATDGFSRGIISPETVFTLTEYPCANVILSGNELGDVDAEHCEGEAIKIFQRPKVAELFSVIVPKFKRGR